VKRDYCAIAQAYAKDVLAGRVKASRFVHAACKRQTEDLKRFKAKGAGFQFDKAKASKVCQFIELLPHIKGPKTGQLIELEPWQIFILTTIFGRCILILLGTFFVNVLRSVTYCSQNPKTPSKNSFKFSNEILILIIRLLLLIR
jgi:hypothetical protein